METKDLQGLAYRCLEDCGFCCTFTAEVSPPELATLRAGLPTLPVVRAGETTLLGLQGGCGACTLLKDRKCTAYEQRPAHCRYFPFHVYFGRRTEAYANRSCRGVEAAPGGSLEPDFQQQVLAIVPPFRLQKQQEKSTSVHRQFERQARGAGVWGNVDVALRDLVQHGAAWFGPETWPVPVQQDGEAGSPGEAWQVALRPFGEKDPMARPYLVAKDLRWLGFHGDASGIDVEVLAEDGSLAAERRLEGVADWYPLPDPVRHALAGTLRHLAGRDVFAGSVFSVVDETGYEVGVADAARVRVADTAADLALRAALLHKTGMPWDEVPGEVARFYDSAFLDVETIGGWL